MPEATNLDRNALLDGSCSALLGGGFITRNKKENKVLSGDPNLVEQSKDVDEHEPGKQTSSREEVSGDTRKSNRGRHVLPRSPG